MRWDDRQVALLREMGVRLWLPPGVAAAPLELAVDDAGASAGARVQPDAARPAATARAMPIATAVAIAVPTRPVRLEPARAGAPVRPAASPSSLAPARPVAPAAGAHGGLPAPAVPLLAWPELRAAVADCSACGLHSARRQTVFGVGLERADWMVIGESPGDAEDIEGVPFVGKAGQLLDNMLQAIGLTRGAAATPAQQVYVTTAVKCRAPGTRSASASELAQCEGFLRRQVQLLQPRIILAMGPTAVQHLLRSKEPIGKLRGRVHDYHGVPLIVTYHPTYLLRHLEDKARVWDDLCLAVQTVK